jgi:hypothetical protein
VERHGSVSGAASRRPEVVGLASAGAGRRDGTSKVRDGVVPVRVSLPGERQPSSPRTPLSRPKPPPSAGAAARPGAVAVAGSGRGCAAVPPPRHASRVPESGARPGTEASAPREGVEAVPDPEAPAPRDGRPVAGPVEPSRRGAAISSAGTGR